MTHDTHPTPRRRGRQPVGDQAMTPAERKAAQRERERARFVTYSPAELQAIGSDGLLQELGRLITAGRPALARAIWAVLEARACAVRAEMHPEQEALAQECEESERRAGPRTRN